MNDAPLQGYPNHRDLVAVLPALCAALPVALFDVDNLAKVNIQFTHYTGDQILALVGRVIACESLQRNFWYFGVYGDRFLVIGQNMATETFVEFVQAVQRQINSTILASLEEPIARLVTASVGVLVSELPTACSGMSEAQLTRFLNAAMASMRGRRPGAFLVSHIAS